MYTHYVCTCKYQRFVGAGTALFIKAVICLSLHCFKIPLLNYVDHCVLLRFLRCYHVQVYFSFRKKGINMKLFSENKEDIDSNAIVILPGDNRYHKP